MSDRSISPSASIAQSIADPTATAKQGATASQETLKPILTQASDIENIWLLPDGVGDLLADEAHKQEWLRYQLTRLLVSCGYQLICPPMIEFTESLLGNASEDLKRQTFKIIDQLSGRLMGVRADITPQILRIDAHLSKLGKANSIARYCYAGHVIRTLPNGLFGSRTPLQLGAEIFGCEGVAAELELLDVLYRLMDKLALTQQLHIDIGHVAIFARLKTLAALSDEQAAALINLYANKALPELKSVCANLPMGADFYQLAVYGHDVAALSATLSPTAKNDRVIVAALNEVKRLVAHIKNRHQGNVSVDITGLGYHYHTGIVFNGYFGSESLPVVRGGRFNGEPVPSAMKSVPPVSEAPPLRSATGFSLEVTRLQRHITLPMRKLVLINYVDLQSTDLQSTDLQNTDLRNIDSPSTDSHNEATPAMPSEHADHELKVSLTNKVKQLRMAGDSVIYPLSANDVPNDMTHRLIITKGDWVLQPV